jgi:protein tyrosine/serine phosphatase
MKIEINTDNLKNTAIATSKVTARWFKKAAPKAIAYTSIKWDNFTKEVAEQKANQLAKAE